MAIVEEQQPDENIPHLDNLIARCETLISEINKFKEHAASHHFRQTSIPMRDFEGGLHAELEHLQRVGRGTQDPAEEALRAARATRSTNLSSYELIWATAKRSTGVTAFRQRYYLTPSPTDRRRGNKANRSERALSDVIAQDGLEWIKVSGMTEKRVLYDFAKEGWGRFEDEFEDEGFTSESDFTQDQFSHLNFKDSAEQSRDNMSTAPIDNSKIPSLPLITTARDLTIAARNNRVRGQKPTVHIVLPRISTPTNPETTLILSCLRELGCRITLGRDIPDPDPPLSTVLDTMPIDPMARLSPTLNIDCTILISLVSDISHIADLQPQDWYNKMLHEQLRFERQEALLPNILYPVLRGRTLLTTETAAKQCRAIVETIGNDGEKARCAALLDASDKTAAQETLRATTDHAIPTDLNLPVYVIPDDALPPDAQPRSPLSARLLEAVAAKLSTINRSVFLFGWRTGFTTISSNNNAVREIDHLLEEHRAADGSEDEVAAPDTWICTPRSVVGKYDVVRRNRKGKKGLNRELLFEFGEEGKEGE